MSDNELNTDGSRDDRLADVIEGYLAATDSGRPPSRAALLEQHPDLAEDLVACLDTLDFIGHSLGQAPATSVLQCGQQFGEYQILREIGRGGMGVVYEAFHTGLERRVALKVLSGHSFEDEKQRERFLLEAKTAAGLHHTNIVPIFEVGQRDGVCYYAMQFIRGTSLGEIIRALRTHGRLPIATDITIFPPGTIVRDERNQIAGHSASELHDVSDRSGDVPAAPIARSSRSAASTGPGPSSDRITGPVEYMATGPTNDGYFRRAARLIAQAAEALAHAHAHGIVHRDVKPSNLIVDPQGRVWVADFGLAFRSDGTTSEGRNDAVGTPAYMSPEQVRPGSAPVDHRTDIYSLGATLYELLTLRPIFQGDSSLAVLTQIASVGPVPPRKINPRIPRDLDAIAERATAKHPQDRYTDAAELAADLNRYLDYEPIRARRVGPIERMILWCRREPMLAGVTTAATIVILLLTACSHWAILSARNVAVEERNAAQRERDLTALAEAQATENLRQALYQQARATRLSFQNGRRWATLDLIRRAQAIHTGPLLRDEAIAALSTPDARLHARLPVESGVARLTFCPGQPRIAFACQDGSVRFWDFNSSEASEAEPKVLAPATIELGSVAFSQCGRLLAAASEGSISVWETKSGSLLTHLDLDDFQPRFLHFLADQTSLVALSPEGACRRWSISTGEVRPLPTIETTRWQRAIPGPGSASVTLLGHTGAFEVWDMISGDHHPIDGISLERTRWPPSFAWAPNGQTLAVAQRQGVIDLWRPGSAQPAKSLSGHRGSPVMAIAFSPASNLLATGGFDSSVGLWDLSTGELLATLREPLNGVTAVSFSPDGRYLAAGGVSDSALWVWEIESPSSLRRFAGHEDVVTQVAVSPDGNQIASGSLDGSVLLWSLDSSADPVQLAARVEDRDTRFRPSGCAGLTFSSDGKLLAVRQRNNAIRVWDTESRALLASLDSHMWGGGLPQFLPGSNELIRSSGRSLERWVAEPGATPTTVATAAEPIAAIAAFPNGSHVVVSTWGRNQHGIELFDLTTGHLVSPSIKLSSPAIALAVSPDNRLIAAADLTGMVRLFNLRDGSLVREWKESDDALKCLTFSPSGHWLGVGGVDETIGLRRVSDAQLVANLPGHDGGVRSLAFGPNDTSLVSCGDDKLVNIWQLETLRSELASLDLAW